MFDRLASMVLLLLSATGLAFGAETNHWSLRPIGAPAVPECRDGAWPQTPIDAFILATLEQRSMHPSAPADRATLLRRVYFDLIGLPPSPGQLAAFLSDDAPNAFEKVIDTLLERPEYGERWAQHWLDVAHYAETHGHDQDRPRTNAWPYRDYVIASLNSDKPYAHFVEEQIAGDTLYPEDPQATVAMGFLATGPWDESSLRDIREDSIDRQIARYIDRDDIVSTVMNTFVSATVQCARCHDHKFDPIKQSEYYSLQAVFAGTDKANRIYDVDPRVHWRRKELTERKRNLEKKAVSLEAELLGKSFQRRVAAWEESTAAKAGRWTILVPVDIVSEHGSTFKSLSDYSILASGPRPETDTYTVRVDAPSCRAMRLEVLTDESLPKQGPGRQDNGNLHLTDFRVYLTDAAGSKREIKIRRAAADFDQDGWDISKSIDSDPKTAWGIYPAIGKPHQAIFEFDSAITNEPGSLLTIVLAQNHGGGHLIGRFRLAVSSEPGAVPTEFLPDEIGEVLAIDPGHRTENQKLTLARYVALQETERELAALPPPNIVYAGASDFIPDASFKPAGGPRAVYLLKRGDIHKPGEPAHAGALHCVPGPCADFSIRDDQPEGDRRAALAKWITDRRNPLTWRSIVNRVWHYHFGRGLVSTPSDFGRMGAMPSHPELLDWLARWFIENGGSLKKLHKLILTSAVYQQSSRDNPRFAELDSENTLLWRMNRLRLEAEPVRDAILAITCTLDPKMGGPSVQQFLMSPGIHVTPKVDYTGFNVDGPEARRRSIYRFIFRTLPDPFMDSLDCPDSSQLTPARNSSVTVGQALAMLNDHFTVRYSEHFAERLERERPGQPAGQIELALLLALQREPRPEELNGFISFVERDGLANFCRVLLNSNEFMFIN